MRRPIGLTVPYRKPTNEELNAKLEPIRIRIMQEAYELADRNDPDGYNAVKAMCNDVLKMLKEQK